MLEISIAAEPVIRIGNFPITNSLLMTWIVMGVLAITSAAATSNIRKIPSRFQALIEIVIGGLYDFFTPLIGKRISLLFPLIASLFLFIIFSNWMGLLPGVGTIGIYQSPSERSASVTTQNTLKFVPLLRAPTADLNTTLALGLIAFVSIQYYGFRFSGLSYGKKFINITNPIFFFVGFLELISDISKIISFAFRLFGNIFAGEVLLAVMAYLVPFFVPVPFLGLEIFVGFIQALVFSMLTAVFIQMSMAHAEHEGHT